jgi:S1-C subfamily serine protease
VISIRTIAILAAAALYAAPCVASAAARPARTAAPAPLVSMSRQMRDLVDRVSPAVVQIAAVPLRRDAAGMTPLLRGRP